MRHQLAGAEPQVGRAWSSWRDMVLLKNLSPFFSIPRWRTLEWMERPAPPTPSCSRAGWSGLATRTGLFSLYSICSTDLAVAVLDRLD